MNLIIDVDGTVADNSHRAHYVMGKPYQEQDWAQFHRPDLVAADLPILKAVPVLREFLDVGSKIIFMTGRQENLREITLKWFKEVLKFPIHSDNLFMRETGNHEPAVKYKRRQIEVINHDLTTYPGPLVFIDDDLRNAEMYQEFGVFLHAPTCWDVFVVPRGK